ncbi:hypothetical protein [Shewanella colwelliana]|uniref:hypothetical protein n=1 Tax=Shewanella colwelliana TaxID=23 RepID=UPI0022B01DE3|nr:hypothetical protein [Shewanella colwelliana]MCZ4337659.1 hypothetical protein [Shewanella colwelliana]
MTNVPQYFIKESNGSTTIVMAIVTETPKKVSVTASLVYSDHHRFTNLDTGTTLAEWSIFKVESRHDKRCMLPFDTIILVKGLGIGSLVRNLVVQRAKNIFADHSLEPAWLSPEDGGEDNALRRHHFYENAGFKIDYRNPDTGNGHVKCADVGKLKVSWSSTDPFQQVDMALFIDSLRRSNRQLTSKIQYAEERVERHRNTLITFKSRYRKHLYASIGVVIFLLLCMSSLL